MSEFKEISTIIFLIGVAGSGKSTWAKKYLEEHPNTIIVSRDGIRRAIFGLNSDWDLHLYYIRNDINQTEQMVSQIQKEMIRIAIEQKKDVVIDNTNLKQKYITEIRNEFPQAFHKYEIIGANLTLKELIERNANRIVFSPNTNFIMPDGYELRKFYNHLTNKISFVISKKEQSWIDYIWSMIIIGPRSEHRFPGKLMISEEVIHRQYDSFQSIKGQIGKTKWNTSSNKSVITINPLLPEVIVFDIDGTLAHVHDRNIFDYKKVGSDLVDPIISRIFRTLAVHGYQLIICTGRDQICEQETRDWLTKHKLDDIHELHMRKEKDHRKDFIIKEEMWRDISTRWNIIAMFDDRNQVVNHARKLGFKVLQVAEGNF